MPTYLDRYRQLANRYHRVPTRTLHNLIGEQDEQYGALFVCLAWSTAFSDCLPEDIQEFGICRTGLANNIEHREYPSHLILTARAWWHIHHSWINQWQLHPQTEPRMMLGLGNIRRGVYRIIIAMRIPDQGAANSDVWTGGPPGNPPEQVYIGSRRIRVDPTIWDNRELALRELSPGTPLFNQHANTHTRIVYRPPHGQARLAHGGIPMPNGFYE